MLHNWLRIIAYFCNMRSLLFLLFLLPYLTYSQINNLVLNPSFEEYSGCPDNTTQIDSANSWFQPLPHSSTEYFNACCSVPIFSGIVNVPSNSFGFQNAKTGIAYSGFSPYVHGKTKEYLEGTLIDPLKSEKKYCVEFYYTIADSFSQYFNSSTLGLFFSNDSLLTDTNLAIAANPQIYNFAINDTINWVRVSGSFIAGGGGIYNHR